jgi:hypothetical protein
MAFYLVETLDQLKTFYNMEYKQAFVEVIPYNDNLHPMLNKTSLVYVKPLDEEGEKGYILSVDHSETLPINIKHINQVLKSLEKIYVRDLKTFLYYFQLKHAVNTHPSYSHTYIQSSTQVHDHFYRRYPTKQDINRIIPVVKHYEKCENLFKNIKIPSAPQDNTIVYSLFYIEKNGIKIEPTLFKQYFNPTYEDFNIKDGRIYTQYNLHTTTGRPSNSFNSINFAALNKDNGCRKTFIPENDKFIEIDISAYHPTLAAKLVGYKPSKPIYEEFAEYAGIDKDEAKILMFRQLYGGIYKEYKDWKFFKLIQEHVNELWNKFNNDGSIQIHDRMFDKNELSDMNPQKLFNYTLQLLETLNNGVIIKDIIKVLKGKNTKIVLTVYDSLLLDFDKNEKHILDDIYQTFDKHKLHIKLTEGINYGEMKNI